MKFVFTSLTGLKTTKTQRQSNTSLNKNTMMNPSAYTKSDSKCSLFSLILQQQPAKEYQLYHMDFEQFLNSLSILLQYEYPQETNDISLYKLLTNNILPHLIKTERELKLL